MEMGVMRKIIIVASLILSAFLNGCATVPMASVESDEERKAFSPPSQGTAGLYIYRNSALGSALKKSVYVDGQLVGETASMTYFYKEVQPGKRVLSTESEFSNNELTLDAIAGQNYFVKQYIKIGLFVGGANLEIVSEEKGKKGVLQCKLANTFDYDSLTYSPKTDESAIEQTLEPAQPVSSCNVSGTYVSEITVSGNAPATKDFMKKKNRKEITLKQTGNTITGADSSMTFKINGTCEGNLINFYIARGNQINGSWRFDSDSNRLEGKWNTDGHGGASGIWNLTKVE